MSSENSSTATIGEGGWRRSVSACSQHATLGRVKARRDGRRVRTLPRSRANPRAGLSGGCRSRAERATAHHSRETQGGASQRPSALAGPLFVCCCVGQAKVNGATIVQCTSHNLSERDE